MHRQSLRSGRGRVGSGGEVTHSWSRHTAALPVLTCRASPLSTVPWVDRAVACVFPRRPLDRGSPNGGGDADTEGGKTQTKQTGTVRGGGGCRPRPGVAQISEPPPVGTGWGSVQAVGGCPEAGMCGQVGEVVWGAVSVWRATGATAWPVQSSKGSKSKGRAPPG